MSAKTKTKKNSQVSEKPKQRKNKTKRIVLTAILIALATVLSMIKVYQLPLGGSITLLSMIPIALISIEYGIKWGITGAFAYSLIQLGFGIGEGLFGWGLSPIALVGSIVLDYLLAYTALGLSGVFRKKGSWGICIGTALAVCLRFCCHLLSGAVIFDIWLPDGWSNPWIYSLVYNGSYMLPELVFTVIGSIILFRTPQFSKLVESNIEE